MIMSACIEWQGNKTDRGYGHVHMVVNGRPTTRKAHRIAYEQAKGTIPAGLCVMHTCDNRGCVNPEHLVVGTHQENMADRNAKGRQAKGSKIGCAKLKETDIPEIRGLLASGRSIRAVAKQFGVDHKRISDIKLGRAWTHVPAFGSL